MAFIGLDAVILTRTHQKRLGFGAGVTSLSNLLPGQVSARARSEDLMKFGLIPEFVGRFPILPMLKDLNVEDMIHLTKPKNALIKQYHAMFELEQIELEFTDAAIKSIASQAVSLKTGARALCTILEEVMLDLMYEVPALEGVKKAAITEEVIQGIGTPEIVK